MTRNYSPTGARMLRTLITQGFAKGVELDPSWFTSTMIQQLNESGRLWLRYNNLANGVVVTEHGLQAYRDSKNSL